MWERKWRARKNYEYIKINIKDNWIRLILNEFPYHKLIKGIRQDEF